MSGIIQILALCDTNPPYEVQTCEYEGIPTAWRMLFEHRYHSRIHALKALVDWSKPIKPDLADYRIVDARTGEVVWGNRGDPKPLRRRRRRRP